METLKPKEGTYLAQGYTVSLAKVKLRVQVSCSSEQDSLHTTLTPHQKGEVGDRRFRIHPVDHELGPREGSISSKITQLVRRSTRT